MKRLSFFGLILLFLATTVPVQPVQAVATRTLVKTDVSSAVYYVDDNGVRHAFPDSHVYFSWYEDFSTVQTISVAEMGALPLGANIVYRPGTHWIKIQSLPYVYAVGQGGEIRWIESETVAQQLSGTFQWNQRVRDVPDTFFVDYTVGDPITEENVSQGYNGLVYTSGLNPWIVWSGERRRIMDVALDDNYLRDEFRVWSDEVSPGVPLALGLLINGQNSDLVDVAQLSAPAVVVTPVEPEPDPEPTPEPEPEPTYEPTAAPSNTSDYLVIAANELIDSAYSLENYREQRGYDVSVVNLAYIGDDPTADEIDDWLDNYRLTNTNLEYVAIMGDMFMVPAKDFWMSSTEEYTQTDLHLAILNEDSSGILSRDLKLGRITVRSDEEFDRYIAKVEQFEANSAARDHILFYGFEAELTYVNSRDQALAESLGFTTEVLTMPSQEDLMSELNREDIAVALFHGHGSWVSNGSLSINQLDAWNNPDNPIVWASGGCGFGDAAVDHRTLSTQMLINETGSVAGVGASDNGGYGYGYEFVPGFLQGLADEGTIGAAFNAGLQNEYDETVTVGNDTGVGSWHEEFVQRMGLEGDPAVQLTW